MEERWRPPEIGRATSSVSWKATGKRVREMGAVEFSRETYIHKIRNSWRWTPYDKKKV